MQNYYNVIYKYKLNPFLLNNTFKIPQNGKIISVESQKDNIVIYALVDETEVRTREIDIKVFGTGHKIDVDILTYTFLGTVKMYNDDLIFHVFYRYL